MNSSNPAKKIYYYIREQNQKMRGALAYFRAPSQKNLWGPPFNAQEYRKLLFEKIWTKFRFSCIVETGSYMGATTEHFAKLGRIQVFSIEINAYAFGYTRARCLRYPHVRVIHGDSKNVLKKILFGRHVSPKRNMFFYLDAHWGEDFPLKEEVSLIFHHVPAAVVMVDDFQVPNDIGFGFDNYGADKVIGLKYLSEVIDRFCLSVFFPAFKSEDETGARRGCVVLGRGSVADALNEITILRKHN